MFSGLAAAVSRGGGGGENVFHGMLTVVSNPRKDGSPAGVWTYCLDVSGVHTFKQIVLNPMIFLNVTKYLHVVVTPFSFS